MQTARKKERKKKACSIHVYRKNKTMLANLSRSRKKERTEKGADDEETTAPLPRFLMNQRKKEKKKKETSF
jgi:hypothetical protein